MDASKNYALVIHIFDVVISTSCKNAYKLGLQLTACWNQENRVFYHKIRNKIYKSVYTLYPNILTRILPYFCQDTYEFTLLQEKG